MEAASMSKEGIRPTGCDEVLKVRIPYVHNMSGFGHVWAQQGMASPPGQAWGPFPESDDNRNLIMQSLGGPSDGSEASRFLPPILHNHYAKVMQKLCKSYAKVMQSYAKLCKVMQSYAKLCKAKIC